MSRNIEKATDPIVDTSHHLDESFVRWNYMKQMREQAQWIIQVIESSLLSFDYLQDPECNLIQDNGQLKLTWDITEIVNRRRMEGEPNAVVHLLVYRLLESHFLAKGWETSFQETVGYFYTYTKKLELTLGEDA